MHRSRIRLTLNQTHMKKYSAIPAAKNIAALRQERDITKLQQKIALIEEELALKEAQLRLAENRIRHLSKTVDEQAEEIGEWMNCYEEMKETCEDMQRRFYQLEQVTGAEQDVKVDAIITDLMNIKHDDGTYLIHMGRQWWGIYRILVDYLGYDASHTRFVKRLRARGWGKARVPLNLSNMKAIEGTIFAKPFDRWLALRYKVRDKHYFYRHYDVANMMKTMVKSDEP